MRWDLQIAWSGLVIAVGALCSAIVLTVGATCLCVLMIHGTAQVVQR